MVMNDCRLSKPTKRYRVVMAAAVALGVLWSASASAREDTLIMFVGEDLEVVSIASRREEAAWQAPAVARVITRDQIREQGDTTLAQALEKTPGFYMAPQEGGARPFLRGISDGVLFLHDSVPLGADSSKSFHPLDHELSLTGVKRIEIIRGPGSVLWGPDAFAGIVNVVPMRGRDLDGTETGALYRHPGDQIGAYLNHGVETMDWDLFLSLSGREGREDETEADVRRFWGDDDDGPVPPDQRYGEEAPGQAHFVEAVANFSYREWLSVSGRLSDYRRPVAVTGPDDEPAWLETDNTTTSYLKLEARKEIDGASAIRFLGSYTYLRPAQQIIDETFRQREKTVYGELIYDRSFMAGKGLLTGGTSFRHKRIEDAPVWESSLPDLLPPENEVFLPFYSMQSYDTRLWSGFAQYLHKFGDLDVWLGLRFEDHDEYNSKTNYNIGFSYAVTPEWMVKAIYGTAYRTPFVRQLVDGGTPDLEEISSVNLQVGYRPSDRYGAVATGFFNAIKDHIAEDFTGLSNPNHQDIYGVELDAWYHPLPSLKLSANATLFDNSGPDETYLYNDFIFIRPDGSVERNFVTLANPYDTGPERLMNFMATWRPGGGVTVFGRLGYSSGKILTYPGDPAEGSDPAATVSGDWLLDAALTVEDLFASGWNLSLSGRNLLDKNQEIPGAYSLIDADPFTVEAVLRTTW